MKTKKNLITIFVTLGATILFAGCAELASSNTESLLSAAGFKARTPQTPKQKEIYAALPPYKVERATYKRTVFYVYKDEKAGIAYVGRELQYQRYQQLAIQQRIAENNYIAADMDRRYVRGFYGSFAVNRIR